MGKIVDGIYYGSDGNPAHRGIVKVDDKIYYAGTGGKIVIDDHKTIHHGMANGLVRHGVYYFDKNGVIDLSSFKKSEEQTEDKSNKNSKKKHKSWKKLSKEKKLMYICGASAFVIILLLFCIIPRTSYNVDTSKSGKDQKLEIVVPTFDKDIYLCTSSMESYYKGDCSLQKAIAGGESGYAPLEFNYSVKGAKSAKLLLSEKKDYSDGITYKLDVNTESIRLDNLKTDTKYYYNVIAENANGDSRSAGGSFRTAASNRFIYLPGVYNTRDIGGYKTLYNKKVKQGLLIRGTELDGLVESNYYLTDVDAAKTLGFVCDFDLRSPDIFNADYVSRLGKDVKHTFFNSPMYGGIFADGNEALLRQIFAELADKNNYPMYFHCTYGADRTGTIAFLLQGLLGVSEEDMMREYELTGLFSESYADGKGIQPVISGLQGVAGSNINEKIENYLVNTVGVTPVQIESIRSIFL